METFISAISRKEFPREKIRMLHEKIDHLILHQEQSLLEIQEAMEKK